MQSAGESGAGSSMQDSEHMTAGEKEAVLRDWERFLSSNLSWGRFTNNLYRHLALHCQFIDHYSRQGFLSTYFSNEEPAQTWKFLNQFDSKNNSDLTSLEYGRPHWPQDSNGYTDINQAMVDIASKYVPALKKELRKRQIGLAQAQIAQTLKLVEQLKNEEQQDA